MRDGLSILAPNKHMKTVMKDSKIIAARRQMRNLKSLLFKSYFYTRAFETALSLPVTQKICYMHWQVHDVVKEKQNCVNVVEIIVPRSKVENSHKSRMSIQPHAATNNLLSGPFKNSLQQLRQSDNFVVWNSIQPALQTSVKCLEIIQTHQSIFSTIVPSSTHWELSLR